MSLLLSVLLLAVALLAAWLILKSRNMDIWIVSYIAQLPKRFGARTRTPRHVYFAFCDHFEPYWHGASDEVARARVARWLEQYPVVAGRHHDSDGRPPQHTFFYPEEEYDESILDGLSALCRAGFGDVEVHLHHDADTAEHLATTLQHYTQLLHSRHGLLRKDPSTDRILFAFIHGNWALDNSHPEGRWCGIDNELSVLVENGCRVDMTMPSAPGATQTRKINSIYFATGTPGQRKSHNEGRDATAGAWSSARELLLVQGPLALNWKDRKLGIVPRIESSEISADCPPTAARVALWERAAISVKGAEEHIFIKVHTHGAEERTAGSLLNGDLELLWRSLEERLLGRPDCHLHYVTAWEMYEKIRELCQRPAVQERLK